MRRRGCDDFRAMHVHGRLRMPRSAHCWLFGRHRHATYNPNAVIDAENCIYVCPGCTDEAACNFDANADIDDNSCEYAQANLDCAGNCLNDANANGLV